MSYWEIGSTEQNSLWQELAPGAAMKSRVHVICMDKMMAVTSFFKSVMGKVHKSPTLTPPSALRTMHLTQRHLDMAGDSAEAFYDYLLASGTEEPLSVPQKLVLGLVREKLQQRDLRGQTVPRLPMVIPKLLRSLRDPDSSAKDYVNIINKDPVMSAAVVKLANSAYFNPTNHYIGNIERAVVKLGISGLRAVLSAAVMQPIIQKGSPYYSQTGQRLWHHSLMCAIACEQIAQAKGLEPFKVYLLGLVHDIGKITVFNSLCKELQLNGDQNPGRAAFLPLLRSQSANLSYCIAQDWQLPEDLSLALQEQVEPIANQPISAPGWILYQANTLCERYAATRPSQRHLLEELLDVLELPKDLLANCARLEASQST